MTTFDKTHLELLDEQANLYGDRPVFWLPANPGTQVPVKEWTAMTYAELHSAVFAAKQFYTSKVKRLGIPEGSVVGLWLDGSYHTDLIHTLGVSAAGYTPQLFSLFYSYSPVVFELLGNSGAKALVFDSRSTLNLSGCPVPVIDISSAELKSSESGQLSQRPFAEVKDDIAVILHSSGSTARIPKLIPWTHRYFTCVCRKFRGQVWIQTDQAQEVPVFVRMGNFNHGAAMIQYIGCLTYGASIVMPSSLAFSSTELLNMIKFCGLNRLTQLSTSMIPHLQKSQNDHELLSALKSLRSISYGGLTIPTAIDEWAHSVGLRLFAIFANTECGMMMRAISEDCPSSHLQLLNIPGLSYKMLPLEEENTETRTRLLELVVLSDSLDCPHPSLLSPDGHFHTGDLFELLEDGHYVFRGRANDWIKCATGLICDTKSIEDAVKDFCRDLIVDCVVVGANRRCPALLVEPADGANRDDLPKIIVQRLTTFNQSRFVHERLDNPGLVLVLGRGALPRTATKGNIRRKAAEEAFIKELDEMYSTTDV